MGNVQFRLSLTPYLYFSSLRLSAAAAEEVLGFILGPFSNSSLPSIPIRTHTHVPCAPIHIRLQRINGFRGAQMKFTAISSACSIDSGWRQPGMMTGSRGENPCPMPSHYYIHSQRRYRCSISKNACTDI